MESYLFIHDVISIRKIIYKSVYNLQHSILEIDLEKGNRKKSAKNVSMEMKSLNSDYVLTMPNAVS